MTKIKKMETNEIQGVCKVAARFLSPSSIITAPGNEHDVLVCDYLLLVYIWCIFCILMQIYFVYLCFEMDFNISKRKKFDSHCWLWFYLSLGQDIIWASYHRWVNPGDRIKSGQCRLQDGSRGKDKVVSWSNGSHSHLGTVMSKSYRHYSPWWYFLLHGG